jgi:hypothetical protein
MISVMNEITVAKTDYSFGKTPSFDKKIILQLKAKEGQMLFLCVRFVFKASPCRIGERNK